MDEQQNNPQNLTPSAEHAATPETAPGFPADVVAVEEKMATQAVNEPAVPVTETSFDAGRMPEPAAAGEPAAAAPAMAPLNEAAVPPAPPAENIPVPPAAPVAPAPQGFAPPPPAPPYGAPSPGMPPPYGAPPSYGPAVPVPPAGFGAPVPPPYPVPPVYSSQQVYPAAPPAYPPPVYPAPPPLMPSYPVYPQPTPEAPPAAKTQGAIALVLGILSTVISIFGVPFVSQAFLYSYSFYADYNSYRVITTSVILSIVGMALGIVGLVLAVRARKNSPVGARGLGTAAMVLSIIGLVYSFCFFSICSSCYAYM